jgi:exopolyphosphatase/guanosine-5'-triphosphate,3'-diphosphate pyrophosphatase
MPVYAGIDIGTLTLRLLVAQIEGDGKLHELVSERRIVRLGEGLQPSRRLQPAPMARALDTIKDWMPVITRAGTGAVVAVATSAVRDALNREEFLAAVKCAAGLEVEVITGEEEARRTLLGIECGLPGPPRIDRFVALDIGGGSTEFIRVGQKRCQEPFSQPENQRTEGLGKTVPDTVFSDMISVDAGVVRLTEECLRADPVRAEDLVAARARIKSHLGIVEEKLGPLAGYRLVGTAGTVTTLAAMDQRLEVYSPLRIHNYLLSVDTVRRIVGELLPRTHAERRTLPGLESGREDLILAGTLILLESMERFSFADCLVSDYGLREGLLIDLWQKTQAQSS